MEIGTLEKVAAAVLLVALPLMATDEETVTELFSEAGDRVALYVSAGLSLGLIAGLVWGLSALAGIDPGAMGWGRGPTGTGLAWAAGVTAAGLASVGLATKVMRAAGLPESRAVLFMLPRDRREAWAFVALALAAGVCEEYVFRGFLLHAVEAWTGNSLAAVAVTSVSFGMAHGYQRTAGVVRATVLGLLLAAPVVATGSLFPAIAAHFGINGIIGLGGWRWLAPGAGPEPPGGASGGGGEDGPGDEDGSGDEDGPAGDDAAAGPPPERGRR